MAELAGLVRGLRTTQNWRTVLISTGEGAVVTYAQDGGYRARVMTIRGLPFGHDGFIAGKPMSLYIIVPPLRLSAYKPLLRAWLSGLMLALTQRKTPPKERTLMLCDEIGNLGRLDALLTAATLLRSWGLTLWTFWQNAAQLSIYGSQANTLVDNAGVIQAFGARNQRMAQDIANLVGGIAPDELLSMSADEQVILMEGKPIRCKQVRHYNDKRLFSVAKS